MSARRAGLQGLVHVEVERLRARAEALAAGLPLRVSAVDGEGSDAGLPPDEAAALAARRRRRARRAAAEAAVAEAEARLRAALEAERARLGPFAEAVDRLGGGRLAEGLRAWTPPAPAMVDRLGLEGRDEPDPAALRALVHGAFAELADLLDRGLGEAEPGPGAAPPAAPAGPAVPEAEPAPAAPAGLSSLGDWRRLHFALTADLLRLQELAAGAGLAALAARAEALRARVEARRFTLAVVGDFKRGKSSFLNALLGAAVLPADVAPTTATVNRVTYGLRPAVALHLVDGRTETVPVEQLGAWVTQLDAASAAAAATVREAVLAWPLKLCRNDVDLVDTPGLGDAPGLTARTLALLPGADAAILVMMADSPFSDGEGRFLEQLLDEGVTDVIYVVNAMDRIRRPEDRERVLRSVRERISARVRARAEASPERREALLARFGSPRVFGFSAIEALEGDPARSGLDELVPALEAFLVAADRLGLERRLEQADALAAELGAALAAQAPVAAWDETPRLDALLDAAEGLLDGERSRIAEAASRGGALVEELVPVWLGGVRQAIRARIAAADFTWPARHREGMASLAEQLAAAVGQEAALLSGGIAGRALAPDPGPSLAAGRLVLAFVLDRLGLPPVLLPAEVPRALDRAGIAHALVPPPERFAAALLDEALLGQLERHGRKSGLDRLLALDFGGLRTLWAGLAQKAAEGACEGWWAEHPATALVRAEVDAVARAGLGPVEALAGALRRARAEVVARRERDRVRAEQLAAGQASARGTVAAVRRRLAAAREAVSG